LFVNVKFVLNLLYLDFEIVSDFDTCPEQSRRIRISDFLLSSAFGGNSTCHGEDFWRRRVNQKRMIMQNKPNFSKPKVSATLSGEKDYEKRPYGQSCKNKPKQSQFPGFPLPIVFPMGSLTGGIAS
jgi:hypothetical protein